RTPGTTPSVGDEREQVVLAEPLSAAQERQLDDEADAAHLASEALDEPADRLDGAAGGEDVVVDQDAGSVRDQLRMELERVRAVFELVRRAHRLRRQLPGPPRGDEAAADLARDRRAEDEAPRFSAEDQIRLLRRGPRRQLGDGLIESLRVREKRRDVLETDAGLRPIRDLPDLGLQVHRASLRGCA